MRNTLAVRYPKAGAEMLVDFVNTRREKEAFERFRDRWCEKTSMVWVGPEDRLAESFFETQQIVREIWEGKKQGAETSLVKYGLGLVYSRPEYEGSSLSLIEINWEEGGLRLAPRDLNEYVWLTLLQHNSQLAICANHGGGCVTPYFLRRKPAYKYCSDACAKPAQRAFKRQWWSEHGEEWRQERLKKKAKRRKSPKR